MGIFSQKSHWIIFSVSSGVCAALNGVFAKLTTSKLTNQIVTDLTEILELEYLQIEIEAVVRAIFFAINLIFNGIMWTLFTKALARGTSTTQVSILNTSSNFIVTAILGFLIFSEDMPQLWFVGASLMITGNVIIGRREENEEGLKPIAIEGEEENLITEDELIINEENKSMSRDNQAPQLALEEYPDTYRNQLMLEIDDCLSNR